MNRWNNLIDLKGDSASIEIINQRILADATIEGHHDCLYRAEHE